jgi:hypothetical protein
MTVQLQFKDDTRTVTRTYRNVIKQKHLAELREYFVSMRFMYKNGTMTELKGKERKTLCAF